MIAANGIHVPGPFTLSTRAEILSRLLELQECIGRVLITSAEVDRIRELWIEDTLDSVARTKASQM
jgi:DNA sulfur modification protein DndC